MWAISFGSPASAASGNSAMRPGGAEMFMGTLDLGCRRRWRPRQAPQERATRPRSLPTASSVDCRLAYLACPFREHTAPVVAAPQDAPGPCYGGCSPSTNDGLSMGCAAAGRAPL